MQIVLGCCGTSGSDPWEGVPLSGKVALAQPLAPADGAAAGTVISDTSFPHQLAETGLYCDSSQ